MDEAERIKKIQARFPGYQTEDYVKWLEIELAQAEAELKIIKEHSSTDDVVIELLKERDKRIEQAEAARDALEIKSKHVVSMINTIRQVMVKSLEHKDVFGGAVYLIDHTHMWALVGNAKELASLLPASLKARIER